VSAIRTAVTPAARAADDRSGAAASFNVSAPIVKSRPRSSAWLNSCLASAASRCRAKLMIAQIPPLRMIEAATSSRRMMTGPSMSLSVSDS
jgi:hypothetical protein